MYSFNGCKVDLDLCKIVIRINTSSKTLEAKLKTHKTCKKSKTQDGTKLEVNTMKKQVKNGYTGSIKLCRWYPQDGGIQKASD
jgi:hypothetical protein